MISISCVCSFLYFIVFSICRYDVGVQQFGCWAINNLALAGEDVRRKLRKAGVVEVIVRISLKIFCLKTIKLPSGLSHGHGHSPRRR